MRIDDKELHEMRIVNKNELEDDHLISNTGDYKGLRVGIMIRRKIRREVGVNDKLYRKAMRMRLRLRLRLRL